MSDETPTHYADRQTMRDREYEEACARWIAEASPEQIAQALETGVLRKRPRKGRPGEFDYVLADLDRGPSDDTCHEDDAAKAFENYAPTADWSNIPGESDPLPVWLAQEFKLEPALADRIAGWHRQALAREAQDEAAVLINRIIGLLLISTGDLRIVAHGLAHAARMNKSAGFDSLHASAAALGCSVEAVRKSAWKWVNLLGFPPLDGAKSPEACAKYRQNGLENHHRKQTRKPNTTS